MIWLWPARGALTGFSRRARCDSDVHHIIDANPPVPDGELPYRTWWPTLDGPELLLELAEERLAMAVNVYVPALRADVIPQHDADASN